MKQLLYLIVHEIRIYLRSKTFWLLGFLVVATAYVPTFNILLIQFVVISAVTRDERTGFSGIGASLPYDTLNLYLARALAVFCLLIGIFPFMVLTVGLISAMEPADWLILLNYDHFAVFTLKYFIICVTAIGFVFFAGMITRQSWKLYFLIGACWLLWVIFTSSLSYFPSWSAFFLIGYGDMKPIVSSIAVASLPQQALLPYFALFQGAMAVLLLLLAIVCHMAKRSERILKSKLLMSLVLMAVTISAAVGFVACRELDKRESSFRLGLQEAEKGVEAITKVETAATAGLESYHLDIKLRTAAHQLEGTAIVKMKAVNPPSGLVFFTLRNCFTVTAVIEANQEKSLEWQRDGSRLAVRIPEDYRQGDTLTVVISYSGEVWEWFVGRWAQPTGVVNFVASTFSLLRSGYAWYPVPGDQPLYTREAYTNPWDDSPATTIWAKRAGHPAVPFDLTVDIDSDSMVVSNLEQTGKEIRTGEYKQRYHFSSLQGRDVFLLTGPYQYERRGFPGKEGFIEVYCYRQHRSEIDKVVNLLAEPYLFYEEVLQADCSYDPGVMQAAKIYTVVEMPPVFFLTADGASTKNLTLTDTVLVSENDFRLTKRPLAILAEIQANKRGLGVLQRWWQEDMTTGSGIRNGNITEGLMLYLYTLYAEKTHGRVFYEQVKQNLLTGKSTDAGDGQLCLPFLTRGPVVRDVFLTLDDIRNSGFGDSAARKFMRDLYHVYIRKGDIDPADFAGEAEAVLAKADWSREKTDEVRRRLENIAQCVNDPEIRRLKSGIGINIIMFNPEEWSP